MIYDAIIIGTGAGGSTVAKELSKNGLKILILEKGQSYTTGKAVRNLKTQSVDFPNSNFEHEKETDKLPFLKYPMELMYCEGNGGTTTVSLANACYSCSACYHNSAVSQMEKHDIQLFEELLEASGELNVSALPAEFMGPATLKMAKAAENLGFIVESMPKFIDFSKCNNCGLCINGCTREAKWDASHFIKQAVEAGADLIENFQVEKVLHEQGNVRGVYGRTINGEIKKYKAKKVIMSAGALNTPKILLKSGLMDGIAEGLFLDLFITIGGYYKNAGLNQEIPMGIKSEFGPFFISPHYSNQLEELLLEKGYQTRPQDVMGIMVKIADEANGVLREDGTIEKELTVKDLKLLKEGYLKAVQVLVEAGVDRSSIVSTPIRGAHPGGTAAVGRVVNKSMETDIKGLYVADASVIERAPGRPPILTIIAIAKCVAKNVTLDFKPEN